MQLSNIERQVLELVCREGKKCRGGVVTPTITRLVEPCSPNATVGALHALKSDGLLSVTGADASSRGWMPTTKGEAALRSCGDAISERANIVDVVHIDDNRVMQTRFTSAQIAQVFSIPKDLIESRAAPRDLLDRCAAMNAALLAQAEKAHAAGDTDAWRDLAWLMETGRQLVAIGGEI
ncbi:MAG: hypothetical protein ACTID3_08505 [Halomonas sp.]|uniref:hypothetical protein n=1 Tax=Halomonas sp. TaxID=1486246 RepID=UPI003F8F3D28